MFTTIPTRRAAVYRLLERTRPGRVVIEVGSVRRHQSGSMDRQGRISCQGHALRRSLLVEAAWLGRRHNPWMERVYQRALKGSPTRKKIARRDAERKRGTYLKAVTDRYEGSLFDSTILCPAPRSSALSASSAYLPFVR